jgi:TorA maturation chaperone TorD
MYRIAGAKMDLACKELPTHIGVELAFMHFLCDSEAAAINDERATVPLDEETSTESSISNYRKLQSRFLQAHLNDWFPQLNRSIQAKAATHFYRGIAQLTEEFIASDLAALMPPSQRATVFHGHVSAQHLG